MSAIEGFRLSPQQKRVWLLQQEDQDNIYRTRCEIQVRGSVDLARLQVALERVVREHEILRTVFQRFHGLDIPLQVVRDDQSIVVRVHDRRGVLEAEQAAALADVRAATERAPFELESGPLVYAALVALAADRHVVLLSMPSLCADATSLQNLALEICRFCANRDNGGEQADASIQYVDFAEWQHELLAAEETAMGRNYWRDPQIPALLAASFPFERGPVSDRAFRPGAIRTRLDRRDPRLRQAEILAGEHDTSLATFFLTCWQLWLWRLSGPNDFVIGVASDNRKHEELKGAAGLFAQYLPCVCRYDASQSFGDALAQVHRQMRDLYKWQEFFSWDSVREAVGQITYEPFAHVCFVWDHLTPIAHDGVSCAITELETYIDRFSLQLACIHGEEGLQLNFLFDSAHMTEADTRRVVDQYYSLLDAVLRDPGAWLTALQLLSPGERRQVLVDWNTAWIGVRSQESGVRSAALCVHHLFEAQATRTPDAIAVVFDRPTTNDQRPTTNDQRSPLHPFTPSPLHPFTCQHLTYDELNRRTNQLAHHLRQLGVGPEVRVGLFVERSIGLIVGLLGILKAGGAYVPLDPALPQERIAWMVQDAQVGVVVTQGHLSSQARAAAGAMPTYLDMSAPEVAGQSAENLVSGVRPDQLVYVMFTSGSTGRPKGVAVTHANLCAYVRQIASVLDLPAQASYAAVSTFAADLGNTAIYPSLCSGGCLHVLAPDLVHSPDALGAYFQQHAIDCLKIVPSHLAALLAARHPETVLPRKWLVLGGEAVGWELAQNVHALAPGCRILNHYGPTETTVGVLTHPLALDQLGRLDTSQSRTATPPLGRPLAHAQVYVLDEQMQPVPVWVAGELYIGGASVARGYLNRPELTAERFLPNPFLKIEDRRLKIEDSGLAAHESLSSIFYPLSSESDRLYKTGDVVRYRADGSLVFVGRADQQVKVRGFRIELGEIEAALAQHPAVQACAVVAREDAPGDRRLVAYVVPKIEDRGLKIEDSGSSAPDPLSSILYPLSSELRAFLQAKLPEYMVPSAFVMLDALPLTPSGKLDRRALPAPDTTRSALASAYAAPQTAAEQVLAGIWQQVLRLERVGIHESFFTLGGDSILSIQVVARAAQAGFALTPKDLFQHQTIARLAAVAQVSTSAATPLEPEQIGGPLPLTPIQRWFFAQELPNPQHYNQALLLQPRASLDRAALQSALQQLLQHHDALRLRFVRTTAGWTAEQAGVAVGRPLHLAVVDLAGVAAERQAAALESVAARAQAGLDLASGNLLRAVYFDLGAAGARLLLIVHHLAVDGVSWRIVLDDLQTAYQQLTRGQEVRLPPKTTAFATWAQQLQTYAQRAELAAQVLCWQAMGAAAPALPLDAPAEEAGGAANTHGTAETVRVALSVAATRALLQEVPRAYQTQLAEVLLTALGLTLGGWSGARTVRVDLEGHGREELLAGVDLTRTVGWYTTLYPLRLELGAAGAELGTVLKAVKEQVRAVPQRGIAYGLLRYLRTADDAGAALRAQPPAQVRFNYLGQLDDALGEPGLFALADEPVGPLADAHNPRSYPLDITALIVSEQLQVNWIYSPRLHRRATIAALAAAFLERLQALIAHCQSPQAGSYTPSDFSDAALDQGELDALFAQLDDALMLEDEQEIGWDDG